MRSIERRFKIEQDKHPEYSSFVLFCESVSYQRFSKPTIQRWFGILVDKDDYEAKDYTALIEHVTKLSHSKKPPEEHTEGE